MRRVLTSLDTHDPADWMHFGARDLLNCRVHGSVRSASGSELLGDRETRHDGLERMFVDIGSPVRVSTNLVLQPIDIPELGRGCVGVEQIVDAERSAPARREGIV